MSENTNNKKNTPFWDVSLPLEERLDWLISQMTLDEKLSCMATRVPTLERLGIPGMSVGGEAAHGIEARNDQNTLGAPEPTTSFPQPIGMSASWDTELIKKAGAVTGTEGRVLYHRHPDRGLSRWAPTVDLERDPRWGRNEEGYGEDPVLTGAMAAAYIKGMQGEDSKYIRVAATLKHFYANNTERCRGWKSNTVDPRNKYELYLEPFRRCIQDGKAEAIMTAYNKINGIPGMLNPEVKDILKKQYGLHHAVCDGGAMELVANMHHYYGLHAETLANAVKAGVDGMSDNPAVVAEAAREAYELNLLTEAELDEALRNMFRTKLRLGIYDGEACNPFDNVTEADLNSAYNQEVCKELSRASVVLLKNDNQTLPLAADTPAESLAVVGPLADKWYQDWYGGAPFYKTTLLQEMNRHINAEIAYADGYDKVAFYYGDKAVAIAEDGSLQLADEPDIFVWNDWGEDSSTFQSVRTGKYISAKMGENEAALEEAGRIFANKDDCFGWFVMEQFSLHAQDNGTVELTDRFDQAVGVNADGQVISVKSGKAAQFRMEVVENGIEKACSLVKGKETVILALGCNPVINAKEEIDRTTIELPTVQAKLLHELCRVNQNVVLVLFSNYPYALNEAQEKCSAIVWSATGSQDMGTAMAETLFGLNAPAGRLNMTWYVSDDQLPDIDDYDIIKGKRTYRYFEDEVLYPFGFGLTYTSFVYSSFAVKLEDKTTLKVSFNVENTGAAASDEVAQVYAAAPASRVKKPLKQLIGFQRLKNIEPGEIRQVVLEIPVDELRFYDVISKSLMVEEGEYQIFAGASSKDLPLAAAVFVPGRKTGLRDLTVCTAADHYDDYENIALAEGQYGFSAATAANPAKTGVLVYRDCQMTKAPETAVLHLKSETGCGAEVLVNDRTVGKWQGDTASYEPQDMFLVDNRTKRDDVARKKTLLPVYEDVKIALEQAEADAAKPVTVEIRLSGDAKLCWFRMV